MNYKEIIKKLKEYDLITSYDDVDMKFDTISYNSKEVIKNTLFVCKGVDFKKEYLEEAIKKGATCYVSEKDFEVNIPRIIVNDSRRALAILASLFYPDNLYKIGITGTKGKTTTNYFIHNILKYHLGYEPGFIATHHFYTGKNEGRTHLTTPESIELHKYLNEMSQSNLKYMSMEASSQSTKHNRIFGMNFAIGCFLNISPDHISPREHSDFNDYFNCKLEFLKQCETVFIYRQIDHYEKIIETLKDKKIITFGFKDADYVISNIENNDGLSFDVNGKSYKINMEGRFNVINATCAIAVANTLKVSEDNIKKGLLDTFVPGRMNIINGGICPVIVDYAHNKLSAEALYKSLKEDYKDKKIKVVFGCPGDKGVNRRKDMGLLAGQYADYVYLTAEDPGHVSVKDICNDIIKYIEKYHNNYEVIEDRKSAIEKAIHDATKDDIIAILGKGDENYQTVNEGWIPYESDIVVAQNEINKIKE